MRKFDELTTEDRRKAIEGRLENLCGRLAEGAIRFNDELNGDDLQARIDAQLAKAEALQTPWFAAAMIREELEDDLIGMARIEAEEAIYLDKGELAIRL